MQLTFQPSAAAGSGAQEQVVCVYVSSVHRPVCICVCVFCVQVCARFVVQNA
jgi:hypothetical protein